MSSPFADARRKLVEGTEVLRTGGGATLTASECSSVLNEIDRLLGLRDAVVTALEKAVDALDLATDALVAERSIDRAVLATKLRDATRDLRASVGAAGEAELPTAPDPLMQHEVERGVAACQGMTAVLSADRPTTARPGNTRAPGVGCLGRGIPGRPLVASGRMTRTGNDYCVGITYASEDAMAVWDALRRARAIVMEREHSDDRYKGRFVRGWSEDDGYFYAASPDEDPGSVHRD